MAISGRGAFCRSKDTVHRYGIRNDWYDFKERRLLEMAREWCADNGIAYAYRQPEKVLQRRRIDADDIEDAPFEAEDEVFYGGFFGFNYTSLINEIECGGHSLEVVDLDVDFWIDRAGTKAEAPEGYLLPDMPILLEISPDRRLVAPDDDHALFLRCTLIDAPLWLGRAKEEGRKTLRALLVPMEVHAGHICKHKAAYVGYWNGKIDDLLQEASWKRRP